ncbi:MAG: TonB-dependent receptor [Rickettsiales bacterium]|nr:TonB-dependent receptor [Rickettsiales bacterium]
MITIRNFAIFIMTKYKFTTIIATFLISVNLSANDENSIIIYGSGQEITNSGSAQSVGNEILDFHNYTNIAEALKTVPGINGYDEDGYGLRPNISMRGSRSERSQGITLMEDNILIAPAPYASPSAYYFPYLKKAENIEVLKGASAVRSGPITTSGALNIKTKSITDEPLKEVSIGSGNNDLAEYSYTFSDGNDKYGYLVNYDHSETTGFKSIDKTGGDTGYDIDDFLAKLNYKPDNSFFGMYQEVDFKLSTNSQTSYETYIGLSDEDYAADPYQRYAGSAEDNFTGFHRGASATHSLEGENLSIVTTVYDNQFKRNWYKVNSVDTANSSCDKLNEIFADTTACSSELSILRGNSSGTINLKANNREYDAKGIQTTVKFAGVLADQTHNVELGLRLHEDDETRYQAEDAWAIDASGNMSLASSGDFGTKDSNNKVTRGTSFAAYVTDEFDYNKFTITPGLRYEHIEYKQMGRVTNSYAHNNIDVFMPGISINYNQDESRVYFLGVNKGFKPSTSFSDGADDEESINVEIGTRYNTNKLTYEAAAFANFYDNLIGECTDSSGCSNVGDTYNAGKVNVVGIELAAYKDLSEYVDFFGVKLPSRVVFSHSNAEFRSSFVSNYDIWGTVTSGDKLPYAPENKVHLALGVEKEAVHFEVGFNYQDKMNTVADGSEATDYIHTVDFSLSYRADENAEFYLNANNIFDKNFVAARNPSGVRVTSPFIIKAGINYKF